jgi:hypothetical protein
MAARGHHVTLVAVGWTEADEAELDVLAHALSFDYFEHRERCDACQPCTQYQAFLEHKPECPVCGSDAPLHVHGDRMTLWVRCPQKDALREHNRRRCACCLPCPHLQRAIAEVLEWREARILLSRAQPLRLDQQLGA